MALCESWAWGGRSGPSVGVQAGMGGRCPGVCVCAGGRDKDGRLERRLGKHVGQTSRQVEEAVAPDPGPHLLALSPDFAAPSVQAQNGPAWGRRGASVCLSLGSVLIGPWGTCKPIVMTAWASGLMPELATFSAFPRRRWRTLEKPVRVCEAPFYVAVKGVLAPEPGNVY